jgi:MoaA/NifB/PqqE/SkfB family radical SAM enzyme
MSLARRLRLAGRFAAHRFAEVHPYEVQAALLNACNLRCVYCSWPERKTALLTTAQWERTLDELAELGTIRVKFQGGEPTMRHDFDRLCRRTQELGILAAVVTNGLPIAERPALLDHLDEVVFSVDSPTPEVHDRQRGGGTHALVVRAIDLARERGVQTFVNMVVTRDNVDLLPAMLDFCEARGIGLNAQPATFDKPFYDSTAKPIALDTEQARRMHRQLAGWKRDGRRLLFSSGTYARIAEWADWSTSVRNGEGPSPCMAGRFYVHVDPNGDVHPCVQYKANVTPKNLLRDGLIESLRHARGHDCHDCAFAYLTERKRLFALEPSALWEAVARR